jgi:hypothetical protein
VCRRRRSFKGHEGIIVVVAELAMVKALVVNSLSVVQLHRTAVIIAEMTIVNDSMVCADRTSWGLLPLVSQVLGAVGPQMLHRFVREGKDGARYLAIALGLLIA